MATRKQIKPYAVDLVKALRSDAAVARSFQPTAVDLADVTAVKPQIIISPQNALVDYEEDYLIFQIDPDSLEVDDVVVMGRSPAGQPIVLGKADWSNPDPFTDPELKQLKKDFNALKKNVQHVKPSVKSLADLPNDGNDHGDLRVVAEENSIHMWDGEAAAWAPVSGGAEGEFVDESGDTVTGDLVMTPGTMITLPDAPVNPTDVVNKAYVDALFSQVNFNPLINTITVNANYLATEDDDTILVDCTLNTVGIILPANHVAGKEYFIKDKFGTAETFNITIISEDADSIDLLPSFVMNVNYQGVMVVSDGTDWYVT